MGNYIHSLSSNDIPDYKYLRELLRNVSRRFYENVMLEESNFPIEDSKEPTPEEQSNPIIVEDEIDELVIPNERESCTQVPHLSKAQVMKTSSKSIQCDAEENEIETVRRISTLYKITINGTNI